MTAQVTMLTDEQAAIAAARKYAVSLDQPKTNEYHIRVDGFVVGARFARDRYEARLAEDAKVRAQLFHALDNLYAMVNGECPSLLENDHHDDMVRDALAAAKGIKCPPYAT